jgi:predicted RNA binding protein YcfA (HicA-like mRNA interferase family)
MSRLANISGKDAVKVFRKFGWYVVGQVGNHVVMSKDKTRANLSIPQHKELSIGTLRSLIRNSGLTVEEFITKL